MTYSLQVIHLTYEIIHCTGGAPWIYSLHLWNYSRSYSRSSSFQFSRRHIYYSRVFYAPFQKVFSDCHSCIHEVFTSAFRRFSPTAIFRGSQIGSAQLFDHSWCVTRHQLYAVVELGTEMHQGICPRLAYCRHHWKQIWNIREASYRRKVYVNCILTSKPHMYLLFRGQFSLPQVGESTYRSESLKLVTLFLIFIKKHQKLFT